MRSSGPVGNGRASRSAAGRTSGADHRAIGGMVVSAGRCRFTSRRRTCRAADHKRQDHSVNSQHLEASSIALAHPTFKLWTNTARKARTIVGDDWVNGKNAKTAPRRAAPRRVLGLALGLNHSHLATLHLERRSRRRCRLRPRVGRLNTRSRPCRYMRA